MNNKTTKGRLKKSKMNDIENFSVRPPYPMDRDEDRKFRDPKYR